MIDWMVDVDDLSLCLKAFNFLLEAVSFSPIHASESNSQIQYTFFCQ